MRPGDWTCPKCGANVFASKAACFKCGTARDGSKGDGKGKGAGLGKGIGEGPPPPEKFSEELWERPRQMFGLKLVGEMAPQAPWQYPLCDESRRSFAAWLKSPFPKEQTAQFFATIRDGTEWQQPEGPQGPIPRKTAWMVSNGCACTYRYGSIEVPPQQFPEWMIQLMNMVMPNCGLYDRSQWPNSCNLNLYEDGAMSVGWHSDDERLFQGKFQDIRIVSLSLGCTRRFEMRPNWPAPGERPVSQLSLGDGDLCTMEGMFQKHFQHRVPKESYASSPRINLTWRWNIKHYPQCPASRRR